MISLVNTCMKFMDTLQKKQNTFNLTGVLYKNYKGFIVLNEKPFVGYIDTDISNEKIDYCVRLITECIEWSQNQAWFSFYPPPMNDLVDKYSEPKSLDLATQNIKNTYSGTGGVLFSQPFMWQPDDAINLEFRETISELIRQPKECFEPSTGVSYTNNEFFSKHCDTINYYTHNKLSYCAPGSGGARICTALLYLNDDFEGGETEFPNLGLNIKPKKGRLLLWHNVGEDAMVPDTQSLHAGKPVTNGTKHALTIWCRINPIDEQTMAKYFNGKYRTHNALREELDNYNSVITQSSQEVIFKD